MLQCPYGGCSHGYYAPFLRHGAVDLRGNGLRYVKALAMQLMLFHLGHMHGLKGSQTNVQGDLGDFNPALADSGEDFRGEVQTRSGSGNAASLFRSGIDGLVALAVLGPVWPRDVRGQRHMSQFFDRSKKVRYRIKAQGAFAKISAACDFGNQLGSALACCGSGLADGGFCRSKKYFFSHTDLSPRTHQSLPLQRSKLAGEENFDAAVEKLTRRRVPGADGLGAKTRASPVKTSGKDAAVVHHQQVIGAEQRGKIC